MIIDSVLELHTPKDPLPLIFDSPHSGTHYPVDFHYACDFHALERAEDKHVDDLFSAAPNHGASLLNALFPRSYIDVNRAHDDIDMALFDDKAPDAGLLINPTKRSHAGIGLIRRLLSPNAPIYHDNLSPKDVMSRIETYYKPYHNILGKIIDEAHRNFGQVWHMNCHSMPSTAFQKGLSGRINPLKHVDFVLGDRDGTSCDLDFTHAIRDFLRSKGYIVTINNPYKGVELVARYSQPSIGRHSIQIEISKALYLDENTHKKNKNYGQLKADITDLIAFCANYARANLIPLAAD